MAGKVKGGALACVAAFLVLAPASGAQELGTASGGSTVGGCQLAGNAAFSPGLNTSSRAFTYSFGGNLTGCQSSDSGSPTSGTVSAGQTIAEHVANSVTGATDTVHYQEPIGTGSGGCASSTTAGTAVASWSDGTVTLIKYTTSGALAVVDLSGTVVPSITLTATDAQAGDPTTYTLTTTRYGGATANGTLAFQPPDPTACNTSSGVTAAGISGFVGLNG